MSTWILLRGLTREAAHWGDFPAVFQRLMPDAQVVTLDLPGNGQYHRHTSPATVRGMVAACRKERVRLGVGGPVHLLAMSLGAMVAAEWARVAPDELVACVLINTSLKPFSPVHHRLLPHNYPTLLRLALGCMSPEDAERTVFRLTCNHPARQTAVIDQWVQIRRLRPVRPGNGLRQLVAAARYQAPRQVPRVPILLLGSENDRLVSHHCSEAMARAWDCPLRSHPTAGHDLPQDDPLWVAQGVCDWLASARS